MILNLTENLEHLSRRIDIICRNKNVVIVGNFDCKFFICIFFFRSFFHNRHLLTLTANISR